MRRWIRLGCAVVWATACRPPLGAERSSPGDAAVVATDARARAGVRFVHAPPTGDAAAIVRDANAAARREGRTLLVYVGAVWCEPCQHFHHAADRGALDADLPTLTLLEFDLDRDDARLREAGYGSQMIPLFAVPGADGRATSRHIEGSVHGAAAAGQIAARLRPLLAPK
jgi:hypothetical protein